MEGFTASKYKQLVLDKKPKLDMTLVDNALKEGLESFTFFQGLHSSADVLESEINNYLERYKDNLNKIVAKVETMKPYNEGGLNTYESKVVLSIVQKPTEYLKEQGKKFAKETKKESKYDKNKK